MENRYLLILAVGLCSVTAYMGPDLPPGPYCVDQHNQPQCCDGREDDCSHPILDTLCYCDVFCTQRGDCCPDYVEKCYLKCTFQGLKFSKDEQVKQDCNTCTCKIDVYTNSSRWECPDVQCIISSEVLDRVRGNDGWIAENYTQWQGTKLKDGLLYKLGTLPLSPAARHMGPIRYDKEVNETQFDSRRAWPRYISPVIDQGWCGSDWAVALAAVASDRFAIQSKGAERMVLSPQSILSCNNKGQRGCDGGHIDNAWSHVKNFGLVSEPCFPYKATRNYCPFSVFGTLAEDCGHTDGQRKSRYMMGPAGRLMKEKDIMHDIKESGPVFAVMTVYQDFFHYRTGIYRHTQHGDNQQQGLHSVRIVGWGEEYGDEFWIVANSWGTEWGERGYFRIARGSNESGIESFVVTSTPEVMPYWKSNEASEPPIMPHFVTTKVVGTECHCEEYCKQTRDREDRYPDYFEMCHGTPAPPPPTEIVEVPTCTFEGVKYYIKEQVEQDCKNCTCLIDPYINSGRWLCSDVQCIISSEVLDSVRGYDGWIAENYTQWQGKKLKDGLLYKLGTLPLSPAARHMGPIRYDKEVNETQFDSRRAWPRFISPVIDQGWCGSDWAVALAAVASDRFAIQSNGSESMLLSPQSILSCNEKGQRGCDGGHIDNAWNHARNFGLVSELCFPYEAIRTSCPFSPFSTLPEDCGHPDGSRYSMGPAGRLTNDKDIMFDIKESGPVFAVMTVYQDFFHYRSGIYRHTQHGDNQQQGLHSVRIVGWGEEYGDKFWIVANSWGTEWGEDGYFRIARGSNESGIESFVVTSTPEVIKVWKKK